MWNLLDQWWNNTLKVHVTHVGASNSCKPIDDTESKALLVTVKNNNPFKKLSTLKFEIIIKKKGHSTDISVFPDHHWDMILGQNESKTQCYYQQLYSRDLNHLIANPDNYIYSARVKDWD